MIREGLAVPRGAVFMVARTLEQILTERRDVIIARFIAEVRRQELAPAGVPRALLVDHLPTFLDEIVTELGLQHEGRDSLDATDASITARRHGGQRWSLGYDLEAVLREYGVLRHCVLRHKQQKDRRKISHCVSTPLGVAPTENLPQPVSRERKVKKMAELCAWNKGFNQCSGD